MRLITPLARARGLGSAKEGVSHWWTQRLTAVALVPLVIWFVYSLVSLLDADQSAVQAWIGGTLNATLLIALIVALFYHMQLGLQVVIEDYIHSEWQKIGCIVLVKFLAVLGALSSVLSILNVFLGFNAL